MKKIILLLGMVILLSGCSATYDIEIYNNDINEQLSFWDDSSKIVELDGEEEGTEEQIEPLNYGKMVDNFYKEQVQAFDNEGSIFLKQKKLTDHYKYGIKYSYKYSTDNYKNAYIPNTLIKYFNFLKEKNIYILSTGEGATADIYNEHKTLDNLTIHLKTNHKVKNNNADRVDGYNYYWDINRSNYTDKKIYIELDTKDKVNNYEGEITTTIIIVLSIAIFALIVIIFLNKKRKSNNKI